MINQSINIINQIFIYHTTSLIYSLSILIPLYLYLSYQPNFHFYVLVIPNLNIAIFFKYYISFPYRAPTPWTPPYFYWNPFDWICLLNGCLLPTTKLFYLFIMYFFTNPPPTFLLLLTYDLFYNNKCLFYKIYLSFWISCFLFLSFKNWNGFYIYGSYIFFCFIEFISWLLFNNF